MDFNDAQEQRSGELIPDGTFIRAQLNFKPGGFNMQNADPNDLGLFKQSKTSDAIMLECEHTILFPPALAHRKIFDNMVVAGGNLDEKGVSKGWNMTKTRIRAILESAQGIDPKDASQAAAAKRQIPNFKFIDGIPYYAKVGIEAGGDVLENGQPTGKKYPDKNVIERIIVPGDAEYGDLVNGKDVEPKPRNAAKQASNASGGGSQGALPWGASTGRPTPAGTSVGTSPAWAKTGADAASPGASSTAGAGSAGPSPSGQTGGPAWLNGR